MKQVEALSRFNFSDVGQISQIAIGLLYLRGGFVRHSRKIRVAIAPISGGD